MIRRVPLAFLAFLAACKPEAGEPWAWDLPEGFPEPVVPDDNPMSEAKVELGKKLFFDDRLSGNETQSCGGCHEPALAFTDGKANAVGSTGEVHPRSSMSLVNVAYASTYTWASEAVRTLEDQALLPMFGERPVELGLVGREDELFARLGEDPEYPALFAEAFPDEPDPVALGPLVKAIASYERSLISGDSPYDRFIYGGDDTEFSLPARRGLALFRSERLECFHCHGSFLFSDSYRSTTTTFDEVYFHNTALYDEDGLGAYPESDQGLYKSSGDPADMGKFRAPTLRNVALTAPYMHDGSVPTLDAVIDHYAAGGRAPTNPHKSLFLKGFTLTAEERADLIAFLESLTDESALQD